MAKKVGEVAQRAQVENNHLQANWTAAISMGSPALFVKGPHPPPSKLECVQMAMLRVLLGTRVWVGAPREDQRDWFFCPADLDMPQGTEKQHPTAMTQIVINPFVD
eukprot:1148655-Pelagomonas_calceolata.AAC.6